MFVIKAKTLIIYALIISIIISATIIVGVTEEDEEEGVPLPILMYHSICDNSGKESKFVISKKEFEEDLKYIRESGYTTIGFDELIGYVAGKNPLPEKPIMLTFDDGYFNNYCYAYPLLKKYGAKAVISIIGKYTDLYSEKPEENPNYSHITWEQAREMCQSGLVEIQNHSYDSHTIDKGRNGTKKKRGETEAAYADYIYRDIGKLQDEIRDNLGYIPEVFVYPFGSVSEASFDILKDMGFKATLSCEEKVNYVKAGDRDCLYMLGRYLRSNRKGARSILKK